MNRRHREFLDRQMRRLQPSPHPVGVMMLILAGTFLVGVIAGSTIFTSQQSAQTASTRGKTALAFLLSGTRSESRIEGTSSKRLFVEWLRSPSTRPPINQMSRHGTRWGNIPDSLAVIAKIAAKGLQGTCRRSYLNFLPDRKEQATRWQSVR
jgi:hypothetical protein